MRLLAIDLGYSSVKVAYYNENNIVQFEKFISATAKVDKPLDADGENLFQLGPDYYILGTPALKVPRSLLYKLETYEDMKVIYPIWVSYLLKRYGGLEKFDKVVIGLSMAFSDKADDLLDYLYETLNISISDYFMCLPQGLSCKLAYQEYGLDLREASKKNDLKMRSYLIVDGGFETLDLCSVIGSASAGAAIGVKDTGIIRIAYNVVDYLYKTYEIKMSIKEAQVLIDNGGIGTRRGRVIDISTKVNEFVKNYISDVLSYLNTQFDQVLDGVDGVLICGGLAYFFKKYINDPDVVSEIEKYFPVSFLKFPETDGEYYNVASYLRIAEKIVG